MFDYASVQPLSVAIFLSASVSLAKRVEPKVNVVVVVTVANPLITANNEALSKAVGDRSKATLKPFNVVIVPASTSSKV